MRPHKMQEYAGFAGRPQTEHKPGTSILTPAFP